MLEIGAIEAIRAAQAPQSVQYLNQMQASQVADPEAVSAFNAAMGVDGPDPVPFAAQVSEAWRTAQDMYQVRLGNMESLVNANAVEGFSMQHFAHLQYQMVNLGFQMELVSNVAKKASSAIETLVKNG